jgi:hypothetical protein
LANLAHFRSTHEVSKDFDYWDDQVPVKDGAPTVAVHVYRDHGSQFVILEKMSCVPRRTWFEYAWHVGSTDKCDTLEAAESAFYHAYVQEAA